MMADETSEPQKPEIDMEWVAQLLPFGMQLGMRMRREEEVEREHLLANLVRDYLIGNTALGEEQRDQIQLEVTPTQFQTHYLVNYVLPGEPEDQPHTVVCFWKDEQWKVLPLPGAPL
jgi:hypothetical protein